MPVKRYVNQAAAAKRRIAQKKKKQKQSAAKKALSKVNKLSKFVMKTIERKQIDYQQTVSLSSSGSATFPFLLVTQGTADGSAYPSAARTGNKVTLMSQAFDMNIVGSSSDIYNQIRILIVESVDGSTTLGIEDILKYSSYGLNQDLVFISPYKTNAETNKRYKVHFDKTIELNGAGTAGRATKQLHLKVRYPNGKIVNFNDNNSAPIDHKMHLLMISDSSAVSHPTVTYNCRSVFRDA